MAKKETKKAVTNLKEKKEVGNKEEVVKKDYSFTIVLILSMVVFFTYKQMVEKPKMETLKKQKEIAEVAMQEKDEFLKQDINSVFSDVEKEGGIVTIDTGKLHGSISLQGARFDHITLSNYYNTIKKEQEIELLKKGNEPYFVEYGWTTNDRTVDLPTVESIWKSDVDKIDVNTPATLKWDNGAGLIFIKKISIDENYMVSVEQSIENNTGNSIAITPYTKIIKEYIKHDKKDIVRREGPVGSINGILEEDSYKKIKKGEKVNLNTSDGWYGFSDKYWLVSSIFDKDTSIEVKHEDINNHDIYEIMIEGESQALSSMSNISYENKLFVGPKELKAIDTYMGTGIYQFDKAIDFGWYYFLTKPFYYILNFLGELTGNFGIAILIFTIILRIAMFPIANKSYASMNKMKKIQPKVKELRNKYGNDKQKMQQKTMELYKKEQISPMGGCLPMLLQIPIFFSLYKVLSISIEMRHAPFFGWIQDLSVADPTNIFTLFGLVEWNAPALLTIGVWPIIMGVTMFLQQKMNPKPEDKSQAMAFALMPLVFTFMMARFSAGLVIYWTFSNVFAIGQQWVFKKTHK